jgi:translocation and assembly module TamA
LPRRTQPPAIAPALPPPRPLLSWRLAALAAAGAALSLSCAHSKESAPPPGTPWVDSLTITGNHAFSSGDIRDVLATQPTGWWPFAAKRWFDPAALDVDLQRIPAFYADRGYFDARVVSHEVKPEPDGSVAITIAVDEKAPTKIADVALQGMPPDLLAKVQKLARRNDVRAGEIVDYGHYAALKTAIQQLLKEGGYAYATVAGQIAVDRDKHTAAVQVTATPGPLVHMGKTDISGNGDVPARAPLHRVIWKEGDVFNPRDIDVTRERIYAFGVFSSVRIDLPPEPTPIADVHIHVLPGRLRQLKLGAGVAAERQRQEVRLRAEWTINNFLGGLRKLRLRSQPGYVVIPSFTNVEQSGVEATNDIQLIQPDLLGSRVTLTGLVGYDLTVADGYQSFGPRSQLGVDRPFLRDRILAGLSWNLQFLQFRNVNADIFNDVTSAVYGFENPYRLVYIEEFVQIDLRNGNQEPTFGSYLAARAEQGSHLLGGAFNYDKWTVDLRGYVPLGRQAVLAGRFLGGWLRPHGIEQGPITRRYALGGPSSQRGFSLGRLAPQVEDSQGHLIAIGGNAELLFSVETRINFMKISDSWLGVIPFLDAGDVTPQFQEMDVLNLHVATGLSLQYATAIGVLRAGFGVRLNRLGPGNPDPGQRFVMHLAIGEAF